MLRDLRTVLQLPVPMIVRLGRRRMPLNQILSLTPGALIELLPSSEEPLELMANNKVIGRGFVVKIGPSLGLRISQLGGAAQRVRAMAAEDAGAL